MRICVVGNPDDLNATYLGWQAEQLGMEVLKLPEPGFGLDWWVDWRDDDPGAGILGTATGEHRLDSLLGAVVRFEPAPGIPEELALEPELALSLVVERRAAIQHWLNHLPGTVVNRPGTGRANGSKPFQMARLARRGLDIPPWCLTNDPVAAREFAGAHAGDVIVKSPSGLRSQVRRLSNDLLHRLDGGTTPVILQRYVAGADVRVHVVLGPKGIPDALAFATEVSGGEGVDYRFESDDRQYRAGDIPTSVEEACARAAASEGLLLAGLDFKVDADGRYWCLEMNPVPTFLPYEASTGQPIAAAVLRRMVKGRGSPSSWGRGSVAVTGGGSLASTGGSHQVSQRRGPGVSSQSSEVFHAGSSGDTARHS
jgi:hypothetical protein